MPLYEFQCSACGRVTEVLTRMGDTGADLVCADCGNTTFRKCMSVTVTPTHPLPQGGKTCCGRDERCDSPQGGCCSR